MINGDGYVIEKSVFPKHLAITLRYMLRAADVVRDLLNRLGLRGLGEKLDDPGTHLVKVALRRYRVLAHI